VAAQNLACFPRELRDLGLALLAVCFGEEVRDLFLVLVDAVADAETLFPALAAAGGGAP